ncbi:GNAT family N-acetyltransferase [Dysgonomonas macrotermitis]|uniref:Acetyltransferase (GNAT) domain-containing protein n=1 Tax=Dysgonomonas macrotermitis TaxID=1346286 RepID=A0A1M5ANF6_9BACT|nr:GNAT family N-acetyltransferase [Dysgonomonas macrotermitis]SHF31674.1 Acetyltransferase (GNAT) domain-containing protein [Dysgonomonas macrotermitis]
MILRKVTIENKSDLEFVEKLYIESFPANERRPVLEMHHVMDEDKRFSVFLLVNEEEVRVGFVTIWDLNSFLFIEHFAISPEQRNSGSGSKAMQALIAGTKQPLVGEIELPGSSDFAARRYRFYEKLGFEIWDMEYAQPPYVEGYDSIPMLMLTYRDLNFPTDFEKVKNTIYKEVYKQDIYLNNI